MAAIEVANPGLKGVLPKDYNRPALDKAKDILGRAYEYFLNIMCGMERLSNEALPVQAMVLLHPKEMPLCLTGTVSKIC